MLTEFSQLSGVIPIPNGPRKAHNPNVSPKKFWGLFGQKARKTQQITLKTQQITLFHPEKRFILNPNRPRTDLQLKTVTPSSYPMKF